MTENSPSLENSSSDDPEIVEVDVGETLGGIYVQLSRIYDIMILNGLLNHRREFEQLIENHKGGILSTPPPVIREYLE